MIDRNISVKIVPTVAEIAGEIYNMTSDDQILLLSCLDIRFNQIPADGEVQLGYMLNALREQSPFTQDRVKHIVKALYQYLVEEDNSEIEENSK